ncbi:MAG TPA: guanylate kinase [Aquiluna sp.]
MKLVVLAGPAGVGKGSLVKWITSNDAEFMLSVSATTRAPRPGEQDGVHYHFVTTERFEDGIASGDFLEWAQVHNHNYYGTLKSELDRATELGKHLLLEIDLQGARQVQKSHPEVISIFITPPSWEELEQRLRNRATETESEIQTRLTTARRELEAANEFDFQLINDDLEFCAQEIIKIVKEAAND